MLVSVPPQSGGQQAVSLHQAATVASSAPTQAAGTLAREQQGLRQAILTVGQSLANVVGTSQAIKQDTPAATDTERVAPGVEAADPRDAASLIPAGDSIEHEVEFRTDNR